MSLQEPNFSRRRTLGPSAKRDPPSVDNPGYHSDHSDSAQPQLNRTEKSNSIHSNHSDSEQPQCNRTEESASESEADTDPESYDVGAPSRGGVTVEMHEMPPPRRASGKPRRASANAEETPPANQQQVEEHELAALPWNPWFVKNLRRSQQSALLRQNSK